MSESGIALEYELIVRDFKYRIIDEFFPVDDRPYLQPVYFAFCISFYDPNF